MMDFQVMNIHNLKTAASVTIKELVNALLALPKKLIVTYLNLQFKAVFFPVCFVIGGMKFVYQLIESPRETEAEPSSEEIVNAVKRLRNSFLTGIKTLNSSKTTDVQTTTRDCSPANTFKSHVKENGSLQCATVKNSLKSCNIERRSLSNTEVQDLSEHQTEGNSTKKQEVVAMSVLEFCGSNVMWDIPIIAQKAKYLAKLIKEGEKEKIAAARKALNEHPSNPMPKTRKEYEKLLEEAKNGSWVPSTINKSPKASEDVVQLESNRDGESDGKSVSNIPGKKQKKVEFALDGTEKSLESVPKCRHDLQLILQNKLLRRRLTVFNGKLDEVFKACNNLIKEISNLNDQFDKFIFIKDKMANLQSELGEGKKLLREVEADRNEMRSKLMALEKLIEEEVEFLDDVSGESGFEETDVNGDSTDDL